MRGTSERECVAMNGLWAATIYGPGADEIGGAFTMRSSTNAETFVGGFGGKR